MPLGFPPALGSSPVLGVVVPIPLSPWSPVPEGAGDSEGALVLSVAPEVEDPPEVEVAPELSGMVVPPLLSGVVAPPLLSVAPELSVAPPEPPPASCAINRAAMKAAQRASTWMRRFMLGGAWPWGSLLDHRTRRPFVHRRIFPHLATVQPCHRSALRMAWVGFRVPFGHGMGEKGNGELPDDPAPRKRFLAPNGEWSGQRESNPHGQLGRLELYH